jgi:hypothetical protein
MLFCVYILSEYYSGSARGIKLALGGQGIRIAFKNGYGIWYMGCASRPLSQHGIGKKLGGEEKKTGRTVPRRGTDVTREISSPD